MAVQFKHIMLMVKDIPATVKFYSEGLGLKVVTSSPGWAELDADGTTIALYMQLPKMVSRDLLLF